MQNKCVHDLHTFLDSYQNIAIHKNVVSISIHCRMIILMIFNISSHYDFFRLGGGVAGGNIL